MANYSTIAGAAATSASGNVTAETAFGLSPANTVRTTVGIPAGTSNSAIDSRELVLRIGILATGGTAGNYTINTRFNSGGNTNLTTFTNDTAIGSLAAFAIGTNTRLCVITARMYWDANQGRLEGCFMSNFDTTFTTWAALTAGQTTGLTNATSIQFLVTGIFSASNAANTATLKYMELDLI